MAAKIAQEKIDRIVPLHVDGKRATEIAAILGISQTTVNTYLYVADVPRHPPKMAHGGRSGWTDRFPRQIEDWPEGMRFEDHPRVLKKFSYSVARAVGGLAHPCFR